MNTKLIVAAGAIALAFASQYPAIIVGPAMAGEPSICAVARSAITRNSPAAPALIKRCAEQGGDATRPPPLALGRVTIPTEPDFCALARDAIAARRPTAGALVQRCLAVGGNVDLPPAMPSDQAASPVQQPSGSASADPSSYDDGISCGEGRSIVRHSGFRNVHTIDCNSDVFTYSAQKHDQLFKVFVNSDGDIVHVGHLIN
jgi:hypothetical protein